MTLKHKETAPGPSDDEKQNAWEQFCRTGCIRPGFADVVAARLKRRRESEK